MKHGLYSTVCVAREILSIDPTAIHRSIYRGDCPAPANKLGNCLVWEVDEIRRLAEAVGKEIEFKAFFVDVANGE